MPALELNDNNFEEEVLKSDKPVLVDFWAEWCGPCKVQGPIVEEFAEDYKEKAKVGQLEVDQNSQSAQKYGIMSIPTLIIFKDGKPVWQASGVTQKAKLAEELDKVLA